MRLAAIRALDWLDEYVLCHRSYRFRYWLDTNPWWDT